MEGVLYVPHNNFFGKTSSLLLLLHEIKMCWCLLSIFDLNSVILYFLWKESSGKIHASIISYSLNATLKRSCLKASFSYSVKADDGKHNLKLVSSQPNTFKKEQEQKKSEMTLETSAL